MRAYKFIPAEVTSSFSSDGLSIQSLTAICNAKVKGWGAVNPETELVESVVRPEQIPYFIVMVKPHSGPAYPIITGAHATGDIYYPLTGNANSTTFKIDHDGWTKRAPLTDIDHRLINETIRLYCLCFAEL